MGRHKLVVPPEVQEQMRRDYRQGVAIKNIAKIYGIGRNKAYEIVHGCYSDITLGRPKISRQPMIEDFSNGLSIDKIAKKYGYKRATVCNILNENGIKFSKIRSKDRQNEIVNDLRSGYLSQSEIARKYNVSRQYVSLIKKEMEANKNENLAL